MHRREFFGRTLKTAGTVGLIANLPARPARAEPGTTPHFVLVFHVSGGCDASYLFDARSLALTDAGQQANYLYCNKAGGVLPDAQPFVWRGANGNSTLCTPLVRPLEAFKQDLTVVNGVMMLTNGLIGHGQNLYYLFTGNSGNTASFVPTIGHNDGTPLDSIHVGGFEGCGNLAPNNFSGSIQLTTQITGDLAEDLKAQRPLAESDPLTQRLLRRFQARAAGDGSFAAGAGKASEALARAPDLAAALAAAGQASGASELETTLDLAGRCLRAGVTHSMTIVLDHDFVPEFDLDAHSVGVAQAQLGTYQVVARQIETCLRWLKTTPFDAGAGLAMIDVTTAVFVSEFSRTLRQEGLPIDATGTDHNPYTNTVLCAGKGIRGGLVLGASDLTTIDDAGELTDASPAHRQRDPGLYCAMGRPFDFATGLPRTDAPQEFVSSDYLTFSSVVNTLFALREVPDRFRFSVGPGDPTVAPIIAPLLKS